MLRFMRKPLGCIRIQLNVSKGAYIELIEPTRNIAGRKKHLLQSLDKLNVTRLCSQDIDTQNMTLFVNEQSKLDRKSSGSRSVQHAGIRLGHRQWPAVEGTGWKKCSCAVRQVRLLRDELAWTWRFLAGRRFAMPAAARYPFNGVDGQGACGFMGCGRRSKFQSRQLRFDHGATSCNQTMISGTGKKTAHQDGMEQHCCCHAGHVA